MGAPPFKFTPRSGLVEGPLTGTLMGTNGMFYLPLRLSGANGGGAQIGPN